MPVACLLFNGIQYSFPATEKAMAWAMRSGGSLIGLFLRAKQEPKEGYVFPSDLDAAENLNTTDEARASHTAIINSNIRLLQNEAIRRKVEIEIVVMEQPSEEELQDKLKGMEMVFTSDTVIETGVLTVDSIDLEKFLSGLPMPVEKLPE